MVVGKDVFGDCVFLLECGRRGVEGGGGGGGHEGGEGGEGGEEGGGCELHF